MNWQEFDFSRLFASEELAIHIADTLATRGLIDKVRFQEAVAAIQRELDAQHGMGRIVLNAEAKDM